MQAAPDDPAVPSVRSWLGCALIVIGALVLVAGLLVLDGEARASLAFVVAPAVALVAAGAALSR